MNVPAASKRGSADVMPSGPNSSASMNARIAASPPPTAWPTIRLTMLVVPDE